MARRQRGKKEIAIDKVPYAIQTTIKPLNIKTTLLKSDPDLVTLNSLIKKYIKKDARRGCKRIRKLQASRKGKTKNRILKGEKTADW